MIPVVNLNNNIAKELEMERDGMRRTRRWVGDAAQVTDNRWYQTSANQRTQAEGSLDQVSQAAQAQPRRQSSGSILSRVSSLFGAGRLPIGSRS